jgi:hypothetical protein
MPAEIYNVILEDYLTIYDNKNINKYIECKRKQKIKKSSNKINKLIYKYILNMRIDMNQEQYYYSKRFYKLYYPMNLREKFILLSIKKIKSNNYAKIVKIYKNYKNNQKNKLVFTFNKIIDLLSDQELYYIGW